MLSDTPERFELLEKLKEEKNCEQLEKIIGDYYDNWILFFVKKYSQDYPHLEKNWYTLCDIEKTTPKKIILVSDIIFDKDHSVLVKLCEILTKYGYVVRRASEFIICPKCESCLPSKDVWHLLKEKKFPVPGRWTNHCSNC